jgi:predicted O-methyltransferase YrrM
MKIRQKLRAILHVMRNEMISTAHPNGHFYSPVVDPKELSTRLDELYPAEPTAPGIDFNDPSHLQLIETGLARYMDEYDYPEHGAADDSLSYFYTQNSQFSWLDARALFCFLRLWQPKRVVEVGSGYSSLLMSDIKRRFLPALNLQCVEPFPRPFLRRNDLGLELIEERVQAIPLSFFTSLEAGDVLFIDSSHVCKTGSDVNYLYLKILPLLRPGVKVHVHDIFLPHEYLREWVIDENRSWNEQYLLQAMLMFSSGFKVLFGNYYAFWRYPNQIKAALNHPKGHGFGGGSFYLERI